MKKQANKRAAAMRRSSLSVLFAPEFAQAEKTTDGEH